MKKLLLFSAFIAFSFGAYAQSTTTSNVKTSGNTKAIQMRPNQQPTAQAKVQQQPATTKSAIASTERKEKAENRAEKPRTNSAAKTGTAQASTSATTHKKHKPKSKTGQGSTKTSTSGQSMAKPHAAKAKAAQSSAAPKQ